MTTDQQRRPDMTGWAPPPDTALRGAVPVDDAFHDELRWAYAEVGCGDQAVVAFRLAASEDDWHSLTAGQAAAVGTLLLRVGGAAQATAAHEATLEDDSAGDTGPAFAAVMLKAFDPDEHELPLFTVCDRLADGRHPPFWGGLEGLLNANTRYGGIDYCTTVDGEVGFARSTLEAVAAGGTG